MARGLYRRLSPWFTAGPMAPVLAGFNTAAVWLELAVEAQLDRLYTLRHGRHQSVPASEVTFVVKTFERPQCLARLVRSARQWFPEVPIIVVDDSRYPWAPEGVQHVVLPYDSGVSAGRNAGLELVGTPYFLQLDDDFVLYRHTDIVGALERMSRYPTIDIIAGDIVNLPLHRLRGDSECPLYRKSVQPILPSGFPIEDMVVRYRPVNFFLGRTKRVRLVGWDPEIKRLDHGDFFTRAYGVLLSVYWPGLICLHIRTLFDRRYTAKRMDLGSDTRVLARRYYGDGGATSSYE